MRRGITSSNQSAATSKIAKHCCSWVFSCRQRYSKYSVLRPLLLNCDNKCKTLWTQWDNGPRKPHKIVPIRSNSLLNKTLRRSTDQAVIYSICSSMWSSIDAATSSYSASRSSKYLMRRSWPFAIIFNLRTSSSNACTSTPWSHTTSSFTSSSSYRTFVVAPTVSSSLQKVTKSKSI